MINQNIYIDFEEVIKERFPNKKIPRPLFLLIKKIAHVDDLNKVIENAAGSKDVDFMHRTVEYFDLKINVFGKENLQADDKPMIFAGNHPLGALDAVTIGSVLGKVYGNKIKFYANEFLNELKPLRTMFLPIYKYGAQNRNNAQIAEQFFLSGNHLVTFPAGATSRMRKNGLQDLEWQKNFIQKAVQNKRDVVPLYFKAQNSPRFYLLQYIREFLRLKVNIEMLMLPSEIFKQQGSQFSIYIGKPVPWKTFDKSKKPKEWAKWVRDKAYALPKKYEIS